MIEQSSSSRIRESLKLTKMGYKRSVPVPSTLMVSFFASTCPIRSGVGAIDNPDRFEQAFVQYYIPEDPENFFTHDISMVRRQKMSIFDVLKTFISKITYYTLY